MSSGSGEALVGSTQTGAMRESGHGRGTPGGGTGRSNWGTFFSLCFDLFPSSCLILPPLPFFQLFQRVSLLFIYMSNCINKYTSNSFLTLLTVFTVINNFFFILSISVKRHIQTCYSFMYSYVSFQPCQCHTPHIPIPNQVSHSRGVQCAQLL